MARPGGHVSLWALCHQWIPVWILLPAAMAQTNSLFIPAESAIPDIDTPMEDDGGMQVMLDETVVFYGTQYDTLILYNNGFLLFGDPPTNYPAMSHTPIAFPTTSVKVIAPYWADFDVINGGSIRYRQTSTSSVLDRVDQDVASRFPDANFQASLAFVATWTTVPYFEDFFGSLGVNTMQVVVGTDGQHSFAIFIYGTMEWDHGSGIPVQIGINVGNGVDFTSIMGVPAQRDIDITQGNLDIGHWVFYLNEERPCYPENNCLNGGQCPGFSLSTTCDCTSDYYGDFCSEEIIRCSADPCLNGATCINRPVGYLCMCDSPFVGVNCTDLEVVCVERSCLNGATCKDDSGMTECLCPSQYTGRRCDMERGTCFPGACQNGGICHVVNGGRVCACPAAYVGYECELDSPCNSGPCQHGGHCLVSRDGTQLACNCYRGYAGPRCQSRIYSCDDNPCRFGATCRQITSTTVQCLCANGFDGDFCERNSDLCLKSPCRNGGVCSEIGSTFQCHCPSGYVGALCERQLRICDGGPCLNRGVCRPGVYPNFHCDCGHGFSGERCENEVCAPRSHQCDKGDCVPDDGEKRGYICKCAKGIYGRNCEKGVKLIIIILIVVGVIVIVIVIILSAACVKRIHHHGHHHDDYHHNEDDVKLYFQTSTPPLSYSPSTFQPQFGMAVTPFNRFRPM